MTKKIEHYINTVGDEVVANLLKKARKLHNKKKLNLNATFIGGGFSELLSSLVLLPHFIISAKEYTMDFKVKILN